MKKEEVISAGVMAIVSMLVLIGFTVAWYTGIFNLSTITGMRLKAAEMNNIKVALTSNGEDISVLSEDEKYADIGLQEMTNIESGKLAPGQFGKVTFYLTPSDEGIEYCEIMPTVWIRQGDENAAWYPGESDEEAGGTEAVIATDLEELYEITQRHIDFFSDEAMTKKIDEDNQFIIPWSETDGKSEKEVVIYWKWYYEYPFTETENTVLNEVQKQEKIDEYDAEDTKIGNNITAMKFHFTFSAK